LSSAIQNLSAQSVNKKLVYNSYKIAIVKAEWNQEITNSLYEACVHTLKNEGVWPRNIISVDVPGSFELPTAAAWLAKNEKIDAVIALGCVIKGETPHFDFICQSVSQSLSKLGVETSKPVIFGVLTTLTHEQAKERAGGKLGNKGDEAAISALKMLDAKKKVERLTL
jgi:6,7-dimethyl-8-ribityllumazine synthase